MERCLPSFNRHAIGVREAGHAAERSELHAARWACG